MILSPLGCRKMLKLCGETEDKLAQELIHFELQVERDVIEPLFLLAEVRCDKAGPDSRIVRRIRHRFCCFHT